MRIQTAIYQTMIFIAILPVLLAQESSTHSLPQWWHNWKQTPAFSSSFIQEGESVAFGKLSKKGVIQVAKGGKLRVEYEKGVLLLCDGKHLTQYDLSTRTAQMFDLENISLEWPLLRLLIDTNTINQVFNITAQNDGAILLSPKKTDLPEILLEGKGSFLQRATWTDGTGAKQILTLTAPSVPKNLDNSSFIFKPPSGTKWIR